MTLERDQSSAERHDVQPYFSGWRCAKCGQKHGTPAIPGKCPKAAAPDEKGRTDA
jgi:rubrerythrin